MFEVETGCFKKEYTLLLEIQFGMWHVFLRFFLAPATFLVVCRHQCAKMVATQQFIFAPYLIQLRLLCVTLMSSVSASFQ